jgi:hypothetical protein
MAVIAASVPTLVARFAACGTKQKVNSMRCPYCESGTNDFVPMNQAVEYSGIEMAVNRQGMLRVRVLDDDGSFTTQDIIEIRNCPLCGKRFMKGRCV